MVVVNCGTNLLRDGVHLPQGAYSLEPGTFVYVSSGTNVVLGSDVQEVVCDNVSCVTRVGYSADTLCGGGFAVVFGCAFIAWLTQKVMRALGGRYPTVD